MGSAFEALGRPLRLGMAGGGGGSFIGPVHRAAASLDGRYALLAGVFSSDAERSRAHGAALGLAHGRAYGSVEEMVASERDRPDGIEVLSVVTPNDLHYPACRAALAAGLHVVCDKPMTNTLEEARDLADQVRSSGKVFCLTHNYSGYPMVRQARAMVAAGVLGAVRALQVEYLQAGMASPVEAGPLTPKLRWKLDKERSGPSLVLGDIGTHAHQLACFVSGLALEAMSAELGALVPGRAVDDYAAALLRMEGGVRGTLLASQALAGTENNLRLRVFGGTGMLEWEQTQPNVLRHAPLGTAARLLARGDPDLLPQAQRLVRLPRGHPEGFLEAFANLYRDAAEAIAAAITGHAPDPLAGDVPGVEDGLAGVAFVHAVIRSARDGGAWTGCRVA